MGIYLYSPGHIYKGLDKDCEAYKKLRIMYLEHYLDAVIHDNIWMEKHYFQKITTGIKYDNYPPDIVKKLYSVFQKRAKWCSYYLLGFCESFINDECLNDAERKWLIDNAKYEFTTCEEQQSRYEHSIKDDLYRLFKLYQYGGFASDEDIARFKECLSLYHCSEMENKMKEAFHILGYESPQYQKSFPELVGEGGGLLRFDGCVVKDGQMLLVECQGIQHYEAIDFFGGQEQLEKQQRYDKAKVQFCIKNKIPLLVIRYNQGVYPTIKKFVSRKSWPDIIYEYK